MKQTVVLLHGLARTQFSMSYLGFVLKRAGYHTLNFGYLSFLGSIDSHAHRLAKFVKRRAPHCESLSFVTHSLGSLVVRRFSELYSGEFPLYRAVMLGPPNQGSEFANKIAEIPPLRWVLGPSFKEICTLSLPPATDKIAVGIIAGGTHNEHGMSPFVSGNNDGIVSVAETALEGAKDRIILPVLHSIIMFHPSVAKEVVHFLASERFSDLAPRVR